MWRYEGENDDVAHLTATDLHELRATEPATFIARTQFALATGTQFIGFCSPTDDSGLDSLQPVILTPDGPVYFWFEDLRRESFWHARRQGLARCLQRYFPFNSAARSRLTADSLPASSLRAT